VEALPRRIDFAAISVVQDEDWLPWDAELQDPSSVICQNLLTKSGGQQSFEMHRGKIILQGLVGPLISAIESPS